MTVPAEPAGSAPSRSWWRHGTVRSAAVTALAVAVLALAGGGAALGWGWVLAAAVVVFGSVEGWRRARHRLGSVTAVAVVSLAWSGVMGAAAASGALCRSGRCAPEEIASFALAGAFTPWVAALAAVPFLAAVWAARRARRAWSGRVPDGAAPDEPVTGDPARAATTAEGSSPKPGTRRRRHRRHR